MTVAAFQSLFFPPWVTGELSTLRQMMQVPNEHDLSPNNGLENVFLSDQSVATNPRKGQAKCPGAKTTYGHGTFVPLHALQAGQQCECAEHDFFVSFCGNHVLCIALRHGKLARLAAVQRVDQHNCVHTCHNLDR